MRTALAFFLIPLLAVSALARAQAPTTTSINVYDGFESPALSPLWDNSRLELSSIRMESQIVRAGHQAIAITVHPHDQFEAGNEHSADSERDELMEARSLVPRTGRAQEYTFSEYFPPDFPIVPVRLVIAQWKEYCPETIRLCYDNSPVLAFRYINGIFSITQDLGGKIPITLYQQSGEFRGKWHDFRVQARFVPDATGRIKVWLDGKQIVDHRGITAYAETPGTGYPPNGHIYFKMGLYRNVMQQPMTVYIDEYRKRDLSSTEF